MLKNNMFEDRVEIFNLQRENSHLLELLQEDSEGEREWQEYSFEEIQSLLHLTAEETLKLMNSGLIKSYRAGNEYRATKKSVDDNLKVVKTLVKYRNKQTMSVLELRQILGLGKTCSYRLINQKKFRIMQVFGVIRIDIESFEEWYAGQFHYKKVNGERPGKKYGYTISPLTVAKVLDIPKTTAADLMNNGCVEFIWVNGKRRIKRESFEEWLANQDKYKMVKTIEEVEGFVD